MKKRPTRRMPPLHKTRWRSVLCGAATVALMAGCGGGGGGGGVTPPSSRVFSDEFSGSALDTSIWGAYTTSQALQRTRFGLVPQLLKEGGTSFARLQLTTYNPNAPGTFKGTEIYTRQRFARGNGLEISTRLRAPGVPPGVVFAFFTIYDRYTGVPSDATYLKTEIDFEFLGSAQEQFTPRNKRNRLYLNIWDDWNLSNGYDADDVNTPSRLHDDKYYQVSKNANYDWAGWNEYAIRWYPNRTEYLLNGVIERTVTQVKPNEDMSVHFNIWAATADFAQAYSASLQPAATAGANRTFNVDVDYVTVRNIGGGAAVAEASPAYEPPAASLRSYRNR